MLKEKIDKKTSELKRKIGRKENYDITAKDHEDNCKKLKDEVSAKRNEINDNKN